MNKSKIQIYEPWFFIFFGIFHLHRIWALIDKKAYSNFWKNEMQNRGLFYYVLMGILIFLCLLGIITFIKNIRQNYWWRWIYIIGGSYLLFDLFAIIFRIKYWEKIIEILFNINNPYWNIIWCGFIALGGLVLLLGIKLLINIKTAAIRGG